jgi:hypothetical protein
MEFEWYFRTAFFDGCTNAHLPHRSDSSSLDVRLRRPPRQRLRCVLSMFSSLRVKVPAQPDGGEGLEMMQGLPPRGGV